MSAFIIFQPVLAACPGLMGCVSLAFFEAQGPFTSLNASIAVCFIAVVIDLILLIGSQTVCRFKMRMPLLIRLVFIRLRFGVLAFFRFNIPDKSPRNGSPLSCTAGKVFH